MIASQYAKRVLNKIAKYINKIHSAHCGIVSGYGGRYLEKITW